MACFLVPLGEAIVTSVVTKIVEKKEKKNENVTDTEVSVNKSKFSKKLKWLNTMLWGGVALLAFEHLWHGEIVPWFPFLTAAKDPAELNEALHEMMTVGVTMAVCVTIAWALMAAVTHVIEKKASKYDNNERNTVQ